VPWVRSRFRKCLEIPLHGVQERRRRFSHTIFLRFDLHRSAHVLYRDSLWTAYRVQTASKIRHHQTSLVGSRCLPGNDLLCHMHLLHHTHGLVLFLLFRRIQEPTPMDERRSRGSHICGESVERGFFLRGHFACIIWHCQLRRARWTTRRMSRTFLLCNIFLSLEGTQEHRQDGVCNMSSALRCTHNFAHQGFHSRRMRQRARVSFHARLEQAR
jgi:hypothetical protein